jgi:hypothetical protein
MYKNLTVYTSTRCKEFSAKKKSMLVDEHVNKKTFIIILNKEACMRQNNNAISNQVRFK